MIYNKVSNTIAQLIASRYMEAVNVSPIPTKLLKTANSYIECQFDEASLSNEFYDSDYKNHNVSSGQIWETKARFEITNIILDLILERDVWSLYGFFSEHTLNRVFFAQDCNIPSLTEKLNSSIRITVNINALSSQAYSLIEKRKDQDLLLQIAKKGVSSKFLKSICRLSSSQITLLQKFADTNRPRSGGQTKIDDVAREQIISIWNLNEEHNQLRKFQMVLEKTNYDSMTASRVIASIKKKG